jgi:hypothetical protein
MRTSLMIRSNLRFELIRRFFRLRGESLDNLLLDMNQKISLRTHHNNQTEWRTPDVRDSGKESCTKRRTGRPRRIVPPSRSMICGRWPDAASTLARRNKGLEEFSSSIERLFLIFELQHDS